MKRRKWKNEEVKYDALLGIAKEMVETVNDGDNTVCQVYERWIAGFVNETCFLIMV